MPHPIAYCPSCGALFEARAFQFVNATNITLTNNTTNCPNCGGRASIADGVFNATAEALEIVKASDLTKALYQRFAELIEEAQHQKMDPDEFIDRAAKIHPAFEEAAKALAGSRATVFVALALMLAALRTCSFDVEVKVDVNQLIEQTLGGERQQPQEDERRTHGDRPGD